MDEVLTCPACGESTGPAARFCEACGAAVTPAALDSEQRGLSAELGAERSCRHCGAEIADDGYCLSCGVLAPDPRDHYTASPAPWVGGACDRGRRHTSNEDALAVAALEPVGTRAVLVVCDGVSSARDSAVGSTAAAEAARDHLFQAPARGLGTPESRSAMVSKALMEAAQAAQEAIVAATDVDSDNPASCTLVAAVVDGAELQVAHIGDSRAYLIPDDGPPLKLTEDDSLAQEAIRVGVPLEVAEAAPGAHTITAWLGRDAPPVDPTLLELSVTEPGWLVVCSDGLWNYFSTPHALAEQVRTALAETSDPTAAALALVDAANRLGGQDNITVALARVGSERMGHNDDTATEGERHG